MILVYRRQPTPKCFFKINPGSQLAAAAEILFVFVLHFGLPTHKLHPISKKKVCVCPSRVRIEKLKKKIIKKTVYTIIINNKGFSYC